MLGLRYKVEPDGITNSITVKDITLWISLGAMLYGASLFETNEIWSMGVYATANMLPGSPESWGAILLLAGLSTTVGIFWGKSGLIRFGLMLASMWNLFFSISFLVEYLKMRTDDIEGVQLGLGPFITYLFMAGVFLLLVSTFKGSNALPTNSSRCTPPV